MIGSGAGRSGDQGDRRRLHMRAWVAAAVACALVFACADEPTGPPGSLTVSIAAPSARPLAVGDTLRLEAEVRDHRGEALPGVTLAWLSSNARIVTVGPEGVVTAVGPGTATITGSVGGVSGTVQVGVADPEAAVLLSLHLSTNGDDWTHNDNWFGDDDLGTWYGVETDRAGRVIGLDLSDNNLDGRIPARLGGLAHLQKLDLNGNELTGEIPGELGRLVSLERLDLSRNELDGHIPAYYDPESDIAGLGALSNLVWLDLSGNQLDGEIPWELRGLTSLERLDLSGNELGGSIPASSDDGLGALSNLVWLDLSGNQLYGDIPWELGGLADLERLDLSENELWGHIPASNGDGLGALANLTWLNLSGNQFNGEIPGDLGLLANLETLWLSYNQLEDSLPSELGSLERLTWLMVGDNPLLTGPLPQSFLDLELVEVFEYANTGICVPDEPDFQTWLDDIWQHLGTGSVCGGASQSDRDILEILYNTTDGPNWTNDTNWLTDAPLGDWYGVDTDVAGRVTRLDLSGRYDSEGREWIPHGLSGTIPFELGNLANLSSLYLNHNDLTGTIPTELGNLANLAVLSLGSNSLSGTMKWSYFVGQSEGKAKVDSDWFREPSGAYAVFCLERDVTPRCPLRQGEGRMPG